MSRERWQELDEAATGGRWDIRLVGAHAFRIYHGGLPSSGQHLDSDAEFIAAARTAWPAAERECDQLRAERDQALTLLRAIRRLSEPQPNDSMNAHFSSVAKMIDASGLLDDEGQQP